MALAPDESGILGGQKWHLHTEKLHFCGFQGEQRGRNAMLFSPEWRFRSRVTEQYLHCKLRGWSKEFYYQFQWNECTSHGLHLNFVGDGMFSHGCHRFTQILRVRFVPTERTEHTETSGREEPPTDDTDAHRCKNHFCGFREFRGNKAHPKYLCKSVKSVGEKIFPQNSHTEFGSVGMAGMPYPPTFYFFTLLLFYFSTHYAVVWNSFSNFA